MGLSTRTKSIDLDPRAQRALLLREHGQAEHIAIEGESDVLDASAKQPYRKTILKYTLASKLRGCSTEISILDGHYLGVRSVRPNREIRKYQFDLRFVSSKPIRVRRVAWSWFGVWAALFAAAIGALTTTLSDDLQRQTALAAGAAALLCASGVALYVFLRRTTESLEFRSVHGNATLMSVTGGFGSARKGKQFFVELIKHVYAANNSRPESKQQFLRNEMREHHRLRELGVLSEREYEQSKARILAEH